MRIIIEGADGTGKTTLCKLLAEKYDLDVCHCGKHDPGDYQFYYHTMRKLNVVWDRHTIGELVYPEVFGRVCRITEEEVRAIIDDFRYEGGVVLILTCDEDKMMERLLARGNEEPEVLNKLVWANQKFIELADKFGVKVIDTTKLKLNEIFDLVEKEANYGSK